QDAVLLFEVAQERLQVSPVVLVEIPVDRVEGAREHALALALGEHVEVDRLEERWVAFHRPVDDVLFAYPALPDDLRVGDAVRGRERFLRREFEVPLDIQSLACVTMIVNRPSREHKELTFLVLDRDGVRLLEPALDRWILAVNDVTVGEEIAGEGR